MDVGLNEDNTVLGPLPPTTHVRALMSTMLSRCGNLRVVDLHGVPMAADALSVASFFLTNSPLLKSLDLSSTGATSPTLEELRPFMSLERFAFAGNKLKNVEPFAFLLASSWTLQSLDLSNNLIDEIGQILLCDALRHNRWLSTLELSRNGTIARKNSLHLLSILGENTSLTTFSCSQLTDEHKLSQDISLVLSQNLAMNGKRNTTRTNTISLSSRRLSLIPQRVLEWSNLTSLNLSSNRLYALPWDLVNLRMLEALNISNNEISADSLPVHLSLLPSLTRINVQGNPFLTSGPEIWRDSPASLMSYFASVCENPEPRDAPGRVLFLGESRVGKSALIDTILQSMATSKGGKSTLIEKLRGMVVNKSATIKSDKVICTHPAQQFGPATWLSFWELVGRRRYFPAHAFFMHRAECLFVVCFSLVSPNSLLRLEYWMDSITSKCPLAHVILVATHSDKCANAEEVVRSVREKYSMIKTMHLHGVLAVNALSKSSVESLKALLVSLTAEGPFRKRIIPESRSAIQILGSLLGAEDLPVISLARFYEMCDACGLKSSKDREQALTCLKQQGLVLWFDLPGLRELVVVDIFWLIESLSRLVLFEGRKESDGKLTERDFDQIWPAHLFSLSLRPMMLALLEHFGLLRPLKSCYVLPAIVVSPTPPLDQIAKCNSLVYNQAPRYVTLMRVYRFEAFRPPGFMYQLVTRLLQMASVDPDQVVVWSIGVSCMIEDGNDGLKHSVQTSTEGETDVVLSIVTPDVTGKIMWRVSHAVESLLRNWFQNVKCACFIRSSSGAEVSVEKVTLALQDIRRTESVSKLSGTLREYEKLAPDLLLLRTKRIHADSVKRIRKIGEGSFGVVYLADLQGERVVVKEMIENSMMADENLFSSFQNEVWMLTVLEHPRIIKLIGLTMRPQKTLVMEYMQLGDLRDFLDKAPSLSWPARLCILIDVCLAMDFAHRQSPPIIHKDLKSPNVFLSVTASGSLIAKVADLGLASWSYFGDRGVGMPDNPTWVAPEVLNSLHKTSVIDFSVDVYSFGIIMWEVMSGKSSMPFQRFTDKNPFSSALAEAICQGLRPEPESLPAAPSAFVTCMKRCWDGDPKMRGNFREALATLSEIRDRYETEPWCGLSIHDLGILGSTTDILAFSGGADCAFAVNLRGCVTRYSLDKGSMTCSIEVKGSNRNPVICALPGGGVLVTSNNDTKNPSIHAVARPEEQDRALRVSPLSGKVEEIFVFDSRVILVVSTPTGAVQVILLDSASLVVEQNLELPMWGSILGIAYPQNFLTTTERAESLWILTSARLISRVHLHENALLEVGEDVVIPGEEDNLKGKASSATAASSSAPGVGLCHMGRDVVWSYHWGKVLVWNGGRLVGKFMWPEDLGTVVDVAYCGKGYGFVSSTRAISLWRVSTSEMLASFEVMQARHYPLISTFPQFGGICLAAGPHLRCFSMLPSCNGAEFSDVKRQPLEPHPSPACSTIMDDMATEELDRTEDLLNEILGEFELEPVPRVVSTTSQERAERRRTLVLPVSLTGSGSDVLSPPRDFSVLGLESSGEEHVARSVLVVDSDDDEVEFIEPKHDDDDDDDDEVEFIEPQHEHYEDKNDGSAEAPATSLTVGKANSLALHAVQPIESSKKPQPLPPPKPQSLRGSSSHSLSDREAVEANGSDSEPQGKSKLRRSGSLGSLSRAPKLGAHPSGEVVGGGGWQGRIAVARASARAERSSSLESKNQAHGQSAHVAAHDGRVTRDLRSASVAAFAESDVRATRDGRSASVASGLPAWKALPPPPEAAVHYLSGPLKIRLKLTFKTRFFEILDAQKILFWDSSERNVVKGQICIPEILCLDLSLLDPQRPIFLVETEDAVHELMAADEAEAIRWVDAIHSLRPSIQLSRKPPPVSPRKGLLRSFSGMTVDRQDGTANPKSPRGLLSQLRSSGGSASRLTTSTSPTADSAPALTNKQKK